MLSKQENSVHSVDSILKKAKIWSLVILAQSLLTIFWLLLIPKEPGNAVLLGYSLRRLALLIPMSAPVFASIFIHQAASKKSKWITRLFSTDQRPTTASFFILGGALSAAGAWSFVFLTFFLNLLQDLGALYRLIPLLTGYFALGLEAILFVPLFLYQNQSTNQSKKKKFPLTIFLITFCIFLSGFIVIEITGLGKNPERLSTIPLGVPLLEGQIWYVIGLLFLVITSIFSWQTIPSRSNPALRKHSDLAIALLLWLAAVVLWMSLPLPSHNYFAPEVQPPNFEKYPFSDAEQYDYNSLYIYFGSLENFLVSKPMYVTLLTIFHAIGGLSYTNIVLLQTLVVALFPSVLFFIGRELHSRLGGISIALFAIFREVSSIQSSTIANTSNTKLLLSDMPAALLASILALILIRWFKQKEKRISGHEFLIGGLIGLFILTRIQTMAMVPFALLLIVIRYFPKFRLMLISTLVLMAALALVISPVLLRNHSITGVYWVDKPSSSQGVYRRFLDTATFEESELEAETQEEALNRTITVVSTALSQGWKGVIYFTADNFLRNSINSVLIMPVRLGNQTTFLDYLQIKQPYWAEVYSQPNVFNLLLLILNLAIISLGFAQIYKRNPMAVLAVLGLYLVYSLSSAIVRLSGWRFILPLDWVIYAFYGLGIVEILNWVFERFAGWDVTSTATWFADYPEINPSATIHWTKYATFGLLFLLAGGFIPIRENLLPSLLPEYTEESVCQKIDEQLAEYAHLNIQEDFLEYCLSSDTRKLEGYGIYPRYFKPGEGYYDRSYDPWFGEQDYSRLVFRLIGEENAKVYIKTGNENVRFPNGATVYVVGRDKNKFEAQFILVEGEQPDLVISVSLLEGSETLAPVK